MVTYTDKVVLELDAKLDRYNSSIMAGQRRFDEAMRRMQRGMRTTETSAQRGFSNVGDSMGRMASRAAAAVGSVLALTAALTSSTRATDSYTQIENRLAAIGQTGDAAAEQLLSAALRSRTGIEDMSAAVLRFQKATGDSFDTSIRRVETLNKLLAVGGATATEVSSVMLQLGQALTSGTLQGDELRSLRENAPVEVLDALAAAAGTSRSELKRLGEEGLLTSDIIKRALDTLAETADENFGKVDVTVAAALTNLQSALTVFIGRLDEGTGASDRLTTGLMNLSTWFQNNLDAAEDFGQSVQAVFEEVSGWIDTAVAALQSMGIVTEDTFDGTQMNSFMEELRMVVEFIAELNGAIEGAAAVAREAFLRMADAVGAGFVSAVNAVSGGVQSMVNGVIAAFRFVAQQIDNLTGAIASFNNTLPEAVRDTIGLRTSGTNLAGSINDITLPRMEAFEPQASGEDLRGLFTTARDQARDGALEGFDQFVDRVNNRKSELKIQASVEDAPFTPGGGIRSTLTEGGPGGDGGGGGGGGTGGAGGSGGSKGRAGAAGFSIAEEIRELQLKAAALRAESAALAELNPLSADYAFQVEKVKKEQELLNKAVKEGVALTPANRAAIEQMAATYAQAKTEFDRLSESQDRMAEHAEEWAKLERDSMQGFISDLIAGKSATEALAGAVQKLADRLLDLAFDRLFEPAGGGGGVGGFFDSIISGIGSFFGKRALGGPAQAGQPYIINENTPNSEVFVPSQSGAVLNVPQAQEALRRATQASGQFGDASRLSAPQPVTLTSSASFTFDMTGANGDAAIEEAVNRGIRQAAPILRRQAVGEATQAISQMSRKGSKSFLGIR